LGAGGSLVGWFTTFAAVAVGCCGLAVGRADGAGGW
jgi:hypothetical protein